MVNLKRCEKCGEWEVHKCHQLGDWIPVKNRLPENEMFVLITYLDGLMDFAWWNVEEKVWVGNDCKSFERYTIKYWLPIPTPPEGK